MSLPDLARLCVKVLIGAPNPDPPPKRQCFVFPCPTPNTKYRDLADGESGGFFDVDEVGCLDEERDELKDEKLRDTVKSQWEENSTWSHEEQEFVHYTKKVLPLRLAPGVKVRTVQRISARKDSTLVSGYGLGVKVEIKWPKRMKYQRVHDDEDHVILPPTIYEVTKVAKTNKSPADLLEETNFSMSWVFKRIYKRIFNDLNPHFTTSGLQEFENFMKKIREIVESPHKFDEKMTQFKVSRDKEHASQLMAFIKNVLQTYNDKHTTSWTFVEEDSGGHISLTVGHPHGYEYTKISLKALRIDKFAYEQLEIEFPFVTPTACT